MNGGKKHTEMAIAQVGLAAEAGRVEFSGRRKLQPETLARTNSHALPHCRRLQTLHNHALLTESCVADCAIVKLRLRRNFLALPRPRLAHPCESVAREREARWVARCFSTPIRRPLRPPSPPAPPSVIAMSLRPETHTTSILRPSNSCHTIAVTKSASGF